MHYTGIEVVYTLSEGVRRRNWCIAWNLIKKRGYTNMLMISSSIFGRKQHLARTDTSIALFRVKRIILNFEQHSSLPQSAASNT